MGRGYCQKQRSRSVSLHGSKFRSSSIEQAKGLVQKGREKSESLGSNLNISLINCRSLRKKIYQLEFLSNVNHVDIFLLNETWADDSISNASLSLNGKFNVERLDRATLGGGVCILLKKNINYAIVEFANPSNLEILAMDVMLSKKFRLILVYKPHHSQDFMPYFDVFNFF